MVVKQTLKKKNAYQSWSLAKVMWRKQQFKGENSLMRAKLAINALLFAKGCCEGVTIMELNLLLLFFYYLL